MTPETITILCPLGLVLITIAALLILIIRNNQDIDPAEFKEGFKNACNNFFEGFAVIALAIVNWFVPDQRKETNQYSGDHIKTRQCACGRLFESDNPDQIKCRKCGGYTTGSLDLSGDLETEIFKDTDPAPRNVDTDF